MPEIIIKQSQFYASEECKKAISDIESRFVFKDESDYFNNLVNFSTAHSEPYQRWVRYREGYATSLVDELMNRSDLNPQKDFVADPMVGSGSTVISANRNGFDAFGLDVNPYCKIIADAKLLRPTEKDLTAVSKFISKLPNLFEKEVTNRPLLSEYFSESNLKQILNLKIAIENEPDSVAKTILNACWFFIIEACSNRKKDGNGLATRPSPVDDVVAHFKQTVNEMLTDYREHPFENGTLSSIFTGSAQEFSTYCDQFRGLTKKELGAIIFSPPYANAFNYFESYKMELLFGQLYDYGSYLAQRKEQIRNYRISYGKEIECPYNIVEMLCSEIMSEIPNKEAALGKKDARTRLMPNMLRGYFTDMGAVLEQLYLSLKIGGHCYIVVDQSAYVGVIVPTDIILAHIAESIGFSVEYISVCRKASTSGQQRRAYPYLGTTLRESIVSLKK